MKSTFQCICAIAILCVGLFAQAPITTTRVTLQVANPPLPVPFAQAFTQGATGSTQYYYWVVTITAAGKSAPFGPISISNANGTLNGSNFDTIVWQGAQSPTSPTYDVLRTTTTTPPSGACNCAVATAVNGLTTNDQSNSLNSYTVNTFITGSLDDTMLNTNGTVTHTQKQGAPASTAGSASMNIPTGPDPTAELQGDIWFGGGAGGTSQQALNVAEVALNTTRLGGILCQATGQASTVIDTATTITGTSCTLQAGLMNVGGTVSGKTLRVKGYGLYSITTGTPTLALSLVIGSTTIVTCTSTATTNGATNMPVTFEFTVSTVNTGVTGADWASCELRAVLGASATAAASTFLPQVTAVSSTYDHTIQNTLSLSALAAGASNAFKLNGPYTVEILD